jgi:uncharacterized glyoxalase superfamily protein PhnB
VTARLNLIDVVIPDDRYDDAVAFYTRLGFDVGDGPGGDIRHAHIDQPGGHVQLHLDNDHLASLYNAGFRATGAPRVVIGFAVDSRDEVDALYAELVGAGYEGRQPPYDAFWGARYAVIADPDGNDVGIMSPSDDTMRSWPPTPSPQGHPAPRAPAP